MSSRASQQLEEGEVLRVLATLASESRVYGLHLTNALTAIERLSADMDSMAVAGLLTSLTVARGQPARLGTAQHIEQQALAVFRELRGEQ